MGWTKYNYLISSRLKNHSLPTQVFDFLEDQNYFIIRDKKLFIIKQILENTYNAYYFTSVDFTDQIVSHDIKLESNIDLLNAIKKNLACDLEYQRYFQINSILKNNK